MTVDEIAELGTDVEVVDGFDSSKGGGRAGELFGRGGGQVDEQNGLASQPDQAPAVAAEPLAADLHAEAVGKVQ